MKPSLFRGLAQNRFRQRPKIQVRRYAGGLVFIGVLSFGAQRSQPLFQMSRELLISRFSIEIVHLIRISLKIVEFPLLRLDEEVDQLVPVGSHATTRAHILETWILVVIVEPVFPPRDVRLALGKRLYRPALT